MFVWTKEGIVYVREDNNSKAVKVANKMEMNQILESFRRVQLDGDSTESEETLSQSSTKDQTTDNVSTCRKKAHKETMQFTQVTQRKTIKKSRKVTIRTGTGHLRKVLKDCKLQNSQHWKTSK